MTFKTPSFWYHDRHAALKHALKPFSWLYALGHLINQNSKRPYKCGAPVICLGNIVAGGSGKTPSAIALLALIKEKNIAQTPFFLTRGYGGDEDKILSQHALTIVSADRALGAQEAVERGADLIIMDDGLQNPGLIKDLKFVVIDGAMGFGNGCMIPAGPLRQSLKSGINDADAFILIGDDQRNVDALLPRDKPCFHAAFAAMNTPPLEQPYIAFAGLGYPEKFFDFMKNDLGLNIIETVAFPDHHAFTARDIQNLKARASARGAGLITTEKDAVRLPATDADNIHVLNVALQWKNEENLVDFIQTKLKPSVA